MKKLKIKKQGSKETLGNRLTAAIKKNGMSQKRLANVAGIAPSVLLGWMNGVAPTDLDALKLIADELAIDFTWLCTGLVSQTTKLSFDELFNSEKIFDGVVRLQIDRLKERV